MINNYICIYLLKKKKKTLITLDPELKSISEIPFRRKKDVGGGGAQFGVH